MQEIIVKRDGIDEYTSLEITEDNELKIQMRIDERGMHETFTLEEIDDLQEAISIMKDRLQRNLSNKKETIEFELPKTMSVKDFEDLTGCKCKLYNQKITAIVTPTEQKDAENVSNNEQIVEEKSTYGGEIADFPVEIVERMLECQVEQGNKRDVSIFEKNIYQTTKNGGFNWWETNDGEDFWNDVINNKNFALFFERYPKKE